MGNETRGMGPIDDPEENSLPPGKRYLLLIAIDNYKEVAGCSDLKYPVKDSERFAQLLKDEYGFSEIISLTNEHCKEKDIRDKILQLRATIKADNELKKKENGNEAVSNSDQLVVFFAGHGASDQEGGYWVTYDGSSIPASNWSVLDVLDRLKGLCSQILLIADCCFAGNLSEKAHDHNLFSAKDYEGSKFSIITSGNKFQTVPDKSIFMETLLEVLSNNAVSNFDSLVGDMKIALAFKNAGTFLTAYSTPDQVLMPFLLQRKDMVSFHLEQSFFEFNYKDQRKNSASAQAGLFNMTYLRGTKECGHHLFTYNYFMELEKHDNKALFKYRKYTTSFMGAAKSAEYNIWDEIAKILSIKADPVSIIERLLTEAEATNWLLVIKIDECDESMLEKALKDFWKEVTDYVAANQESMKSYANSIYFFLWDRRGLGENIGDLVTDEKYSDLQETLFTSLLPLAHIKSVDIKKDLRDWYLIVRRHPEVINDPGFIKLDIINPGINTPHTVENVIAQLTEKCDHENVYNNLFCNNKLWIS